MSQPDERDQIDALFARLESIDPGDAFVARVMARARAGEVARWPRWQRVTFSVLYLVALLTLGLLAYLTGVELERSQARELIQLAFNDLSGFRDSPGIYLSAISDALPWLHVIGVVADIAALAIATRLVLKVASPRAPQRAVAAG